MKCVACGSAALVKGTLMENSGGGTTIFKPEEVSIWKSMFGFGTRSVHAYGCLHCKHLQLAVDFSEEDLQHYQQLESEQPGVLEQTNPGPKKSEE